MKSHSWLGFCLFPTLCSSFLLPQSIQNPHPSTSFPGAQPQTSGDKWNGSQHGSGNYSFQGPPPEHTCPKQGAKQRVKDVEKVSELGMVKETGRRQELSLPRQESLSPLQWLSCLAAFQAPNYRNGYRRAPHQYFSTCTEG